ncbi:MAG: hypothetical protein HY758_08830, partial [Nitrospirae bacterium]|nr:hypothetical protein [Nitrospirota bacterium]
MKDKVIIAGAGMVTSLGHSVTETWKALLSGGCGIKTIETPELRGFDCRSAAQVNLIPSSLNIHPRDARIMDMHSLMLMKSSRDAFKEAGLGEALSSGGFRGEDIGFFAGMGMVDYKIEDIMPSVLKSLDQHGNLDYDAFFLKGYQEIHPLWPLSMLNNISFCQVSTDLGIKGENSVFSPHSDSGMQAVAEAAKTLLDRKAKAALAGGVSEKVSLLSLARASYFGILNPADGVCRPFGKDRNGTILGEGCGIIAMELQTSAVQRGMPCLAAISGCGVSFGVSGDTDYPSSSAISDAMGKALEDAELRASDI